jgi:polar amino acid transport system substrate-binding protein
LKLRKSLSTAFLAAAAAALLIAGCGSEKSSSNSAVSEITANPQLASKLPQQVKADGIRVGTFPIVAPMTFKADDGHTVVGADIDLVNAVAAKLGTKTSLFEQSFDGLIPGLQADRFSVAVDSITDNAERQKEVDFLDYLREGSSFYFPKGTSPVNSLNGLCGHTVGVVKGTLYETQAEAQAAKCPSGKPLKVSVFIDQPSVNLALSAKRIDVAIADEPVTIWAVAKSEGMFEASSVSYGRAPLGMAFPKGSKILPLAKAALGELIAEGTYLKILKKWGLEGGALPEPAINGG